MAKRNILWLLKLIGVSIFVWIIYHLNLKLLFIELAKADPVLIGLSILSLLGMCLAKTTRWHNLVKTTNYIPSFKDSWRLFFIGTFLGNITPGKIGELGRAKYLQNKGVPLKIGILLTIIDRACDAILIGIFGIIGLIILGWIKISWWTIGVTILVGICLLILIRKIRFLHSLHIQPSNISWILLFTMVSWAFYFLWAILLALSIGIALPVHILVACFTITGLFSMLPIAPSGFGTRDAALVVLLAPYGILAESAVALALLMLSTILLMSIPGGWYLMKNKPLT